jgi:pentapeptide MXKDX repeat protein
MRWYLRLTTLVASLVVTAWALPGCSSNEETGGRMDGGAMDKGKMDGGAMEKGKMDGGAMDKGKMDGGAMDKGKMEGTSK